MTLLFKPQTTPQSPINLSCSAFSQFDYFQPQPRQRITSQSSTSTSSSIHGGMTRSEGMRDIVLNSPRVLGSPETIGSTNMKERMSVQVGEKAINWARPLKSVEEPSLQIFGASIQRNKRLHQISSTSTSPCTSDEEPQTPPPFTPPSHTRSWSLPITENKGLGFGIDQLPTSSSGSALADYLDTSPYSSSILSSYESMSELSSPTTLVELNHLRKAALDLELQMKSPTRSVPKLATPLTSIRERRIKRKALPTIELVESTVKNIQGYTNSEPRRHVISVHEPLNLECSLPPPIGKPDIPLPPTPPSPITPYFKKSSKTIYGNLKASISAFDLDYSPRKSRSRSNPVSASTSGSGFGSGYSSSEEESGSDVSIKGPKTPPSAKGSVELGLRGLNFSSINLGSYEGKPKHKRGFSRFFKKNEA